jgi:plastocyanin
MRLRIWFVTLLLLAGTARPTSAQAPVTAQVQVIAPSVPDQGKPARSATDASNVVVWLVPLDHAVLPVPADMPSSTPPQIVQHNKSFLPHVLVVELGTAVEFPNKDPFFHNIFSLFDGERFDLGLYESGSSRTVRFDRPGVSFLFCNIHPEMNAVVVAVDTPYFALTDHSGRITIQKVPDGRYVMHVWYERGLAEDLKGLTQRIPISSANRSLGTIRVRDNANFTTAHKNKYGQDYVPPPRPNYVRP